MLRKRTSPVYQAGYVTWTFIICNGQRTSDMLCSSKWSKLVTSRHVLTVRVAEVGLEVHLIVFVVQFLVTW